MGTGQSRGAGDESPPTVSFVDDETGGADSPDLTAAVSVDVTQHPARSLPKRVLSAAGSRPGEADEEGGGGGNSGRSSLSASLGAWFGRAASAAPLDEPLRSPVSGTSASDKAGSPAVDALQSLGSLAATAEDLTSTASPLSMPTSPAAAPAAAAASELVFPTVFTWTGDASRDVYVTGSWCRWKERAPLARVGDVWMATLDLPPGIHDFRFIVDGDGACAGDLPIRTDKSGNVHNVVEVSARKLREDDPEQVAPVDVLPPLQPAPVDTADYSQVVPDPSYMAEAPPQLPSQLLRSVLNENIMDHPTLLPVPQRVMLNHMYAIQHRGDGVQVLGVTHRFRRKFVSTVYYRPPMSAIDAADAGAVSSTGAISGGNNNNNNNNNHKDDGAAVVVGGGTIAAATPSSSGR